VFPLISFVSARRRRVRFRHCTMRNVLVTYGIDIGEANIDAGVEFQFYMVSLSPFESEIHFIYDSSTLSHVHA